MAVDEIHKLALATCNGAEVSDVSARHLTRRTPAGHSSVYGRTKHAARRVPAEYSERTSGGRYSCDEIALAGEAAYLQDPIFVPGSSPTSNLGAMSREAVTRRR